MADDYMIEVAPGEHGTIQELVVSYLRAVERFRTEDGQAGPGDHQLSNESRGRSALTEALNWADAIDNYLRAGPKDTLRDEAWASKLSTQEQELVRAFQRVRNVVHHRWWEAVAVQLQMRGAEQTNVWAWGALPTTSRTGKGRDAEGDADYAARLKGRAVLETLDELAEIFWTKRRWRITVDDLQQPGHGVGTPLTLDEDQ